MYMCVNVYGDAETLEDVVCEYNCRLLQARLEVHLFVKPEITNLGLCWEVGKLQTLPKAKCG